MPNFETHNQYNKHAIVITGIGCIIIDIVSGGNGLNGIVAIPASIFSAYMLSPDLDQRCNGSLRYWPALFDWWWRIYAWMFNHRGLSHVPVIGTLSRVIWLLWPFYLIIEFTAIKHYLYSLLGAPTGYYEQFYYFIKTNLRYHWKILKYVCIGLEFPALMHYAMDFPDTIRKIKSRKYRRERYTTN